MKKLLIRLPTWIRILLTLPTKENEDAVEDSGRHKMQILSVYGGAEYISKSLLYLAEKDKISSCRIHREFGKMGRPYKKSNLDDRDIYLLYLWEGAEKVIETARHISTNPNHSLDSDIRSEIKVLAKSVATLGELCKDMKLDETSNKISAELDFVRHIISVRSDNMRHEHFNDGTFHDAYLTLLYNLHSFLNAASKFEAFKSN